MEGECPHSPLSPGKKPENGLSILPRWGTIPAHKDGQIFVIARQRQLCWRGDGQRKKEFFYEKQIFDFGLDCPDVGRRTGAGKLQVGMFWQLRS